MKPVPRWGHPWGGCRRDDTGALGLVDGPRALGGQFRVLDPLDPFVANPGQAALEGFGLGAGNELDEAEEAFRVPALEILGFAWRRELQPKGGDNLSPPPLKASWSEGPRRRSFFRYSAGFGESVSAAITSVMTNHHSLAWRVRRISLLWNRASGARGSGCLSRSWLSSSYRIVAEKVRWVAPVPCHTDLMLMGIAAAVVGIACDFQPKAEGGGLGCGKEGGTCGKRPQGGFHGRGPGFPWPIRT